MRREAVHCAVTPRNEGCYLLYCQQFPSLNALYGTAMQGVKQGDNVARLVMTGGDGFVRRRQLCKHHAVGSQEVGVGRTDVNR